MNAPTINDILVSIITVAGADGLYNRIGECSCFTDDLAPCGGIQPTCELLRANVCDKCGEMWFAPLTSHPEKTGLCDVCEELEEMEKEKRENQNEV